MVKKNPLEYRKEYRNQNLFFFCDVGTQYGSFRYGILGVPPELSGIMKWFRTLQEAEDFFYENLKKYKHLLSERQYNIIFLGKENLLKNEGCSGVICIETGEAFESCDMAAFIKKDNGIMSLSSEKPMFWLNSHWSFVSAEMPIEQLKNVASKYGVNINNMYRYIQAGFSIFDSINMSKKLENRRHYKCRVYCKDLDLTFRSIMDAENHFRKGGLCEALKKGKPWYGLHFERI